MRKGASVTVWFGKEVDINFVRREVRNLQLKGYIVRTPFYIGYNINDEIVGNYLKNNLDLSDYLYLIGSEGSLLEDIVEYANLTNKNIVRKEFFNLCYQR